MLIAPASTLEPMAAKTGGKSLSHEQNEHLRGILQKLIDDDFGGRDTRAAKALGVSQPLVSVFVKGLPSDPSEKLWNELDRIIIIPILLSPRHPRRKRSYTVLRILPVTYECRCDSADCNALGGRSESAEEAREIAYSNGFRHHVTSDDVVDHCPRCGAGCAHCAAEQAQNQPWPRGASLVWEGEEVAE